MLVLSRKKGERIRIGDEIEVKVLKISGNRVTLGIEAPTRLHIVRSDGKVNITTVNGAFCDFSAVQMLVVAASGRFPNHPQTQRLMPLCQ